MKKGYSLLQVIIIIFMTALISGISVGVIFSNVQNESGVSYTKLLLDENVQDFLNSYSEITDDYYEDIDKEKLIQSAIDGMANYLDESYTSYLSEEEASALTESLNSTYEGIGVIVSGNKVISILDDSPALEAGILENDLIIKVNEEEVSSEETAKITNLIKENSSVVLEIDRGGEILSFNVTSKKLNVPNVSYYLIKDTNIGYLNIDIFSSNVANEVENSLNRLDNLNAKSLVIDLRGNSGGYLDQAYDVAELFLKKGKIVYYLATKSKQTAFKDKTTQKYDKDIIVLIDNDTASAAEILAAALKDSYGATIVGTKSFGKGKVQHTYNLQNGSLFKYTSSKWLRPNGVCVDGIGITPDYIVDYYFETSENEDGSYDITSVTDNQLKKAIELLGN